MVEYSYSHSSESSPIEPFIGIGMGSTNEWLEASFCGVGASIQGWKLSMVPVENSNLDLMVPRRRTRGRVLALKTRGSQKRVTSAR